jgi:phage-related minor tail protein
VQQEYTKAIKLSGGASTTTAALVISNTKSEFTARKQILALELKVLEVRGRADAVALEKAKRVLMLESRGAEILQRDTERALRAGRYTLPWNKADDEGEFIGPSTKKFVEKNEMEIFSVSALQASQALNKMKLEDMQRLMDTEFKDITTGTSGAAPSTKGASGGGKSKENELLKIQKKLFDETRTSAEKYAIEMQKLEDLYQSGAISTEVYQRKMAALKDQYAAQGKFASEVASTVKSSMDGLFTSIFDGSNSAGEAVASLAKKLAAMLAQEGAYRLLASFMPSIFGAAGAIPLLKNANGNAFSGGRVTAFANGGVVGSPTLFPMYGGTGLMGEAGPEAILPLTRGPGGKLGVQASGRGGGGDVAIALNINAQGAQQGVAEEIAVQLQRALPKLSKAIRAEIGGRRSKGYSV